MIEAYLVTYLVLVLVSVTVFFPSVMVMGFGHCGGFGGGFGGFGGGFLSALGRTIRLNW